MNGWLKVGMVKPRCPRDPDALGEPVLIWPRNPQGEEHSGVDGHAYYGRRATGRPAFYKHGAEIRGVTHWMPMPKGPNAKVSGPEAALSPEGRARLPGCAPAHNGE